MIKYDGGKNMKKRKIKTMLEFESVLNHYLTNDIPLALMDDFYELNLRQRGFMMNRVYDYSSKEDSISDVVNGEENIGVSDSFLLMSHNIEEETPVSPEEQMALFKEKDEIAKKMKLIEKEVTLDDLPFIKEINEKLAKFNPVDLKIACDIHDMVTDKIQLDKNLNESNTVVDEDEVRDVIKEKYKFDEERINYFLQLYAEYSSLLSSKKDFNQRIASNNIDEYNKLKENKNAYLYCIRISNELSDKKITYGSNNKTIIFNGKEYSFDNIDSIKQLKETLTNIDDNIKIYIIKLEQDLIQFFYD